MATYEPVVQMGENTFTAPEKLQSKMIRKPLTDMTNSRKPLANISGFKAPEKKVSRKPLGDLTNSNNPHVQSKSSKKNCTKNLSAVNEEQVHSFASGEGFLHDHNECIKANRQSLTMSIDYFLETVALQRDSTPVITSRLPQLSKLEIDTAMEIDEREFETLICTPRSPPEAPRSPGSPCWSTDFNTSEFSPLRLKESPST